MLKPLEQFVCDSCKGVIEIPADGWVEWLDNIDGPNGSCGFRICHVHGKSKSGKKCQRHHHAVDVSDTSLNEVLSRAPVFIYSFIGVGHLHEIETHRTKIKDLKAFLDFARRLTVPYYEEARQFWNDAYQDGMLDGRHEYSTYDPVFLQEISEKFGPYGGSERGDMGSRIIPVSAEVVLYSERLLSILAQHDWNETFKTPEPLKAALRKLGAEIHAKLGNSGMMQVFETSEQAMPERARTRVDYSWSGIGNWLA